MFSGVMGIYYRETMVLRKKLVRVVMAAAVPPFLYLMAFGYGVGNGTSIDGVNYLTFLLPGLLAMASMNQSYNIATEINISRFYLKIFEEFMLAPNQRWQIIAAQVLYGITRGMIPVMVIICYSFICGVHFHYSVIVVIALALHLIAFSLLGFIVALKMRSHRDQASMTAFIITPMMFLSGTFFPVEKMPVVVQFIAAFSPLTYSADVIRTALLGGDTQYASFAILVGFNVLLLALALHIVKRVEI